MTRGVTHQAVHGLHAANLVVVVDPRDDDSDDDSDDNAEESSDEGASSDASRGADDGGSQHGARAALVQVQEEGTLEDEEEAQQQRTPPLRRVAREHEEEEEEEEEMHHAPPAPPPPAVAPPHMASAPAAPPPAPSAQSPRTARSDEDSDVVGTGAAGAPTWPFEAPRARGGEDDVDGVVLVARGYTAECEDHNAIAPSDDDAASGASGATAGAAAEADATDDDAGGAGGAGGPSWSSPLGGGGVSRPDRGGGMSGPGLASADLSFQSRRLRVRAAAVREESDENDHRARRPHCPVHGPVPARRAPSSIIISVVIHLHIRRHPSSVIHPSSSPRRGRRR